MWFVLASTALAFRPTDGTDAGVAERGAVEVQVAPTELSVAADRVLAAGPSAAVALGLGRDWEAGVSGSFGAVGVAVKRRLAGAPDGPGVAVEVGGGVSDAVAVAPMVALSLPLGALALHLDGGGSLDSSGVARGIALAILEGPDLGPVGPVAQVGFSDGTGAPATSLLAGAVLAIGPVTLDAAAGTLTDGRDRSALVRAGLTAAFGPREVAPAVAQDAAEQPSDTL